MKKLFLFFSILFYCSCNESTVNTQQTNTASTDSATHTGDTVNASRNTHTSPDNGIYSILLSDTVSLYLQQWDSTIDLQRHLGKPLKQKTRQLDQNSDTFSGSFIKDLEYDALKLQLFSPPQNGRSFWIQEIILTSNKYKTTKDITIGDEWQKVKQAYPSLQKFPGVNENMYYVADEGYAKSIEMEFEKNKLKKLRMYYMIN